MIKDWTISKKQKLALYPIKSCINYKRINEKKMIIIYQQSIIIDLSF